ncbi:hypothetical protein PHAMO_40012 [Magnetospirillum molischianum DSM 120]|uniref:Uncharacterized protein n=1 Tax=Magnetospirillum molischianum DSM 120 TaxID=1150626 RepID=H8FVR3_MAGML|nr:hypothetical protein PHAMO_40012 [Magnetospirillum molischianum DSM 120]
MVRTQTPSATARPLRLIREPFAVRARMISSAVRAPIVSRRSRAASHDTAFAHSREGGGGGLSSRDRRVHRISFRATFARAARSARARHVCSNASASAGVSSAARAAHAARFCAIAAAKAARIGESLVIAPPAEGVDHDSIKKDEPTRSENTWFSVDTTTCLALRKELRHTLSKHDNRPLILWIGGLFAYVIGLPRLSSASVILRSPSRLCYHSR